MSEDHVDASEREREVTRPSSVQVNLPPDWLLVPLDEVRDLDLDAVLEQLPLEGVDRSGVEAFFLEARSQLRDAPAVLAALYALFDDEGGVVLLVTMLVLIDLFPADDTPALDLLTALSEEETELRDAELVDTPLGGAVRAHLLREPDPADAEVAAGTALEDLAELGDFSVQYFIPLPGRDHLAVVAFTSPNLEVREALVPLFDDIVQTLRFRWPAPPRAAATA